MTILRFFLDGTGYRDGLCDKFRQAAEELTNSAKTLRAELDSYKKAPDPFGELLSTMHNNHEFEKFSEPPVDTGTKPGV